MGVTRRVGWVLIFGSVLAAVDGLIHVAGTVRLFGADGVRLPGWAVVTIAPLAAFAGWCFVQAGALIELRRAERRRDSG